MNTVSRRTAMINQPALFPWWGEWQKLAAVDVAVCLDSVEVQKSGFLTRARICGDDHRPRWLTVPSSAASRHGLIAAVQLLPQDRWLTRTRDQLYHAYRTAPYRDAAVQLFESVAAESGSSAVDLAERALTATAAYLDVPLPPRLRSSTIETTGRKSALVAEIVAAVGANHYIYGPGSRPGRHYLDTELLAAHGISAEAVHYADATTAAAGTAARLSILHDIAHLGTNAAQLLTPATARGTVTPGVC